MIIEYLKYFMEAKNQHSIHSPFVFEFYNDIILNKSLPFDDSDIQKLRDELVKDDRIIKIHDLGAGSKFSNKPQKKVRSIAKTAKKSIKWAGIISRIVAKYEYQTVLELGTSLGLTTSMLSKSVKHGKVYTFEGCSDTLKVAQEGFKALDLKNVTALLGDIDTTLTATIYQLPILDFVFFDANHQYAPTMRYFRQCLEKSHENSCFVFDDIYWSKGMKQAWEEIQNDLHVTLSLDFFQMGIVFFRKNQPKQHFVLKA
jgi:predicted O-methyltransferase YrrM